MGRKGNSEGDSIREKGIGPRFTYFYGTDAEQFNFFRLPKKLIQDAQFSSISCEAKVLYGILLDRMTLSARNGWVDAQNRLYIIYPIKEVMEEFGCCERKAIALMGELDTVKGIGLVEKRRQGLGRPNVLYVKNFNSSCGQAGTLIKEGGEEAAIDPQEAWGGGDVRQIQSCQNAQSQGSIDIQDKGGRDVQDKTCTDMQDRTCTDMQDRTCMDMQVKTCTDMQVKTCRIVQPNNTEYNDTKTNDTDLSIHQSIHKGGWVDRGDAYAMFRENLSYPALLHDRPTQEGQLQGILELLVDTYCTQAQSVRIGGADIPADAVRRRLGMLDMGHIQYVLDALRNNRAKVHNIYGYMLSCLYRAPVTKGAYYQAEVQHDLYMAGDAGPSMQAGGKPG